MNSSALKIAHVGGGSRYWARELLSELAQSRFLQGSVDLFDLDLPAAKKNVAIAEAIFSRPENVSRFRVRAVPRLRDALRGADIVILSIEPGPTPLRYADLVIPERYGIIQPVGDTTGPGGLGRALRSIEIYRKFAEAIADVCPQAWVINYTNPMTLCTAALYAVAPRIKAFGCCHEVFHTQERLASWAGQWFDTPKPDRREITVDLTGINHFTWITRAHWRGRDLLAQLQRRIQEPDCFASRRKVAEQRKRSERWFESDGLIALDLFRRFGALGAAGDRHLAEFVPWYATDEENLHRWGVVLTPYRYRLQRSRARDREISFYAQQPLTPSLEEGVRLIEALTGGTPIDTNVNLPNEGQASDLPLGHIVETNAQFRSNRVTPVKAQPLPEAARALVHRVTEVQKLTLQAGLARDTDLAFQALLLDPLVRLPVDESWKMFKAMLHHMRPSLPGWRVP